MKRKLRLGCLNCRFKCQDKITVKERFGLFKEFWKINDHTRQWYYLDRTVTTNNRNSEAITQNENQTRAPRSVFRQFYLTGSNGKVRVCSQTFFDTFGNYLFLCNDIIFLKLTYSCERCLGYWYQNK